MTCERCQQHMLAYLYDLLEPEERQALAAHLEACPACQDALKLAQEQQGQLADAVKEPQPGIVFKAPAASSAASAPTVAMHRPAGRIFLLNRWAIAATIVGVLLGGAGIIGGVIWRDQAGVIAQNEARLAKAREDLKKSQETLHQTRGVTQDEIRAIQKQIDALFVDWKNDESKTRKKILHDNKGAQLRVIGPERLVAGGRNNIEVEMPQEGIFQQNFGQQQAPRNQLPGAAPMLARVIDQKNQQRLTDWQQLRVTPNNRANFELPPDLPQPGQKIAIEFQAQMDDGNTHTFTDNLTFTFPEYVTHLTTDRPLYRPGDTVRFRSLTLERFSLKPAQHAFNLRYRITGPKNVELYDKEFASTLVAANKESIKGPDGEPIHGVGAGEYTLPADLPSGHYTLSVSEVNERFQEEKRNFTVNRWQTPRFNKEVTFDRSVYGAADKVKMSVKVAPLQGPVVNARGGIQVWANVRVDDVQFNEMHMQTDGNGVAVFEFTLPAPIPRGVGVATIKCEDGANHDTMQRSLPLVVPDLDIDFYPEGGDLIAGVPNRVYFQARAKANRPADIEGRIVDDAGAEVARIQTVTDADEPGINQGLGSFTFTPRLNRRYGLRLDAPIGIEREFALPTAKNQGLVLHLAQGVVENEMNVTLHNVNAARTLLIGAYCRGRWIGHKDNVVLKANESKNISLRLPSDVGGVYRITVFERKGRGDEATFHPLAERLIYRKSAERVDVSVKSDRASYQPGQNVRLQLECRNEAKQFVPTFALVAVVDQSVLKLADEKTARSLPTHFLLTTEIRDPEELEYADVLLGTHPKAALALDLLLGCQGWRRFAEQNPEDFQRRQQNAKAPIFLSNSTNVKQSLDNEQKQVEQLDQNYVVKAIDLQKKLGEKEQNDAGPPALQIELEQKLQGVDSASQAVGDAQVRLRRTQMFFVQFGLGGVLLIALFVGFYLLSVGLRRLSDGARARPWFLTGFGLLGLLFFASVIGTFVLKGAHVFDFDDVRFGNGKRPPAMNMVKEGNNIPDVDVVPAPLEPEDELRAENVPPIARNINNDARADVRFNQERLNNFVQNANVQNAAANNIEAVAPVFMKQQPDRLLRQQGQYQAILLRELDRRVQLPAANDACVVREYAHRRPAVNDDARRDLTETIYWHPALVMSDGKAELNFDLADSVTRFEVLVLSNTSDGRLGVSREVVTSKLPVAVDPRTPIEVSNNDLITVPVALTNELSKETSLTLSARLKGLTLQANENADRGIILKGNQTTRELFLVKPSIHEGTASFRTLAKTARFGDAVERKLKIVPDGIPVSGSISGVLGRSTPHEIELPEGMIPGSLKIQAHFYPSPLAELQNALESFQQEPSGTFEQNASMNYANSLTLNYLKDNGQANPRAERQARQQLNSGNQKLASLECVDPTMGNVKRGYEWFGPNAPPHDALTAYGLLQFRDTAKAHRVDEAMLERTERYLLDRRDGSGGFKPKPGAVEEVGRVPAVVTNAYVVWALTESGVKENLDADLKTLRDQCKERKDPYVLALTALSHLNRKRTDDAIQLLTGLRDYQKGSGEVAGAEMTVTGSLGRDASVETTSLAILGWLRAERADLFQANIDNAVKWLGTQRRGQGDFGSAQATVFALKAMIAHTHKNRIVATGGAVEMSLQDPGAGNRDKFRPNEPPNQVSFPFRAQDPFTITLREAKSLGAGKHVINVSVNNGALPYTLTWSYRTQTPKNDANAPVKLSAKLDKNSVKEGELVKLTALIENVSGKAQGMTIAVLGLPAGLSLSEDALELLKTLETPNGAKAGVISAWELRGRELVLYWRELPAGAKVAIDLNLLGKLPGEYSGPASRAYVNHNSEQKYWLQPLSIRIVASR